MKQGWRYELKGYLDKGVWGFIPIYDKYGGNYTKLIFEKDPAHIIKKRVNTVIGGYAALFQKDLKLIRARAKDITGQRTMNPLPIDWDIILVPFKLRKPVAKDDGALGYYLHSAIDSVVEDEDGIYLRLRNGSSYKILDTQSTAEHHISTALRIHYELAREGIGHKGSPGLCRECGSAYNLPATKGDLAAFMKNLEVIVNNLGELKR